MESREFTLVAVNIREDMRSIVVVYRGVIKPPPMIINNIVYAPLPLTKFYYQVIRQNELLDLPLNPMYPLHTALNYPPSFPSHSSHQPMYTASSSYNFQWWSNAQHYQNNQQWAGSVRPCSCMEDTMKEDEHLITIIDTHK